MTTIRFNKHEKLEELIARIYLDTNKKLSKKELLEVIFEVGTRDYHLLLEKINNPEDTSDQEKRKQFIETFSGVLTVSEPDKTEPKRIWERNVEV